MNKKKFKQNANYRIIEYQKFPNGLANIEKINKNAETEPKEQFREPAKKIN